MFKKTFTSVVDRKTNLWLHLQSLLMADIEFLLLNIEK